MSHPYSYACVLPNEQQANKAFQAIRDVIYQDEDNKLSAFRLRTRGRWYVVIVGDQPNPLLNQRIHTLLYEEQGEEASLPDEIINQMFQRRQQLLLEGATWVEHRSKRPKKKQKIKRKRGKK